MKTIAPVPFLIGVPFVVSLVLTKVILVVAKRRGLVAKPTEDRWHKTPTPIFGGIAIYAGFVVGMLVFGFDYVRHDLRVAGILGGATIMFATGLIDDLKALRPNVKLLFQIFATIVIMGAGVYFKFVTLWVAMPLSVIWLIGITNAFNLLDNMDGLSAGIASIVCLNVVLYDVLGGWSVISFPAMVLMGAMLGFLVFNFHPAKIFMGDSGSLVIGSTLASLTVLGSNRDASNLAITLLFPLLVMAVPIFDTTLVTVLRNLAGRKVSQGGRDHSSHRLVALGLSERNTVLLLYAISLLSGGLVIAYTLLSTWWLVVMALLLWVLLYYFGIFLAQANVYPQTLSQIGRTMRRLPRRLLASALVSWLPSTEVLVDLVLAGVSLTIAFLLRYEELRDWRLLVLLYSMFVVAPLKLAALYLFGVYRQMWRYVTFRDLTEIVKASSVGSVLCVLVFVLVLRYANLSRAVFVIDWLTFSVLVLASRLVIRVLRDSFLRIRAKGTDVLIYGAGDAGNLLLEELFSNRDLPYHPVAVFDDNPSKLRRMLQGLPIVGGADAVADYAKARGIDKLIVAIPSATDEQLEHVYRAARAADLSVYRYAPARIDLVVRGSESAPDAASLASAQAMIDR
jgi:UDP-GlcNAc:undecaprenyl-phosphate GlcNAc-1-phosphate transferase